MSIGKLIVFSGPSGVGKGTIRSKLKFSDYVFSISSTTRTRRENEKDGREYHFLTKDEFKSKIENDEMLEFAEFVGNYYGTDKNVVTKLLESGQNVFLEIECQGALQVLGKMKNVISIFILPPSIEELESRLRFRGTENEEVLQKRLNKARYEIELKDNYKYNVINDNLDDVVRKVDDILYDEFKDYRI